MSEPSLGSIRTEGRPATSRVKSNYHLMRGKGTLRLGRGGDGGKYIWVQKKKGDRGIVPKKKLWFVSIQRGGRCSRREREGEGTKITGKASTD